MENTYVLRAVSENGNVSFYTGRAGDGWLGDASQAFAYPSIGAARRKCLIFNRMVKIHGFWFTAIDSLVA